MFMNTYWFLWTEKEPILTWASECFFVGTPNILMSFSNSSYSGHWPCIQVIVGFIIYNLAPTVWPWSSSSIDFLGNLLKFLQPWLMMVEGTMLRAWSNDLLKLQLGWRLARSKLRSNGWKSDNTVKTLDYKK